MKPAAAKTRLLIAIAIVALLGTPAIGFAAPRPPLPRLPDSVKPAPRPQQHRPKAPAPPAKKPVQRKPVVLKETTLSGRKYLNIRQIGEMFGFRATVSVNKEKLQTITLTTPRGEKIVFTAKKPVFQVSGTNATLSYPVVYQKGVFFLEKTDYTEFLEPLLRTSLLPRREIRRIVIDAGHGGKDQGASSGLLLEKSLNLIMARRVAAILRKRGYNVIMTRNTDKTVTLEERCKAAAAARPDLFLSIHCNSAEDSSIHGIEVFIANPPGVPSFGTTNIGKKGASTPHQRTSALWAYYTQRALVAATKAEDRGIKRKQFKVVIDTPAPAMLVELGFISNKAERAKLIRADYQDKLAVAICDSVDKLRKTLKPKK